MKIAVVILLLLAWLGAPLFATKVERSLVHATDGAKLLVDPASHVRYYLETDGRYLAAISPGGQLLWNIDLNATTSYRVGLADRRATYLGFAKPIGWRGQYGSASNYLEVSFSTLESGIVSKRDGQLTIVERN